VTIAVEIRNIHKSFAGLKALDDVCIRIEQGEMVALIGASGSGKSTLLRHIPGFVAADGGEVEVFGRTMQRDGRVSRRIRHERSRVGFVFQQFNLVGRLPVITNVMIGLLHRSAWWRRALMRFSVHERREAIRALCSVGIGDTCWQRASTLSGGQQQRAALARCLVQDARLILADEPIASLDPESSRKVMELLADINLRHGCTVLVSLHQVEFAVRYCARTIALDAGRVVYDGPSAALTPAMLDTLYGRRAHELLEPEAPAGGPAPSHTPAALLAA
jgi:phosphonate transport system ATP-binding protein